MRISRQQKIFATVTIIALAIALPAVGQKIRGWSLRANPYRDIGGSCVYGRDGGLVFAPKGSSCASPSQVAPETATGPADRFAGLSAAFRSEMKVLLEGHSHVAEELTKLRLAVGRGRKSDALLATDHIVRELTAQVAREERLFEKLSAGRVAAHVPASQ